MWRSVLMAGAIGLSGFLSQPSCSGTGPSGEGVDAGIDAAESDVGLVDQSAQDSANELDAAPSSVPTITSVTPPFVYVGSSTTLSVVGTGFTSDSKVRWDNTTLTTQFVTTTELRAVLDTTFADLGAHSLTVFSPNGASAAFAVDASNPVPDVIEVTPTSIAVQSTGFNIGLYGHFVPSSVAVIGTEQLPSFYSDQTLLFVTIPATHLSTPGVLQIGAFNPGPGGGYSPTTASIAVKTPNPRPTAYYITPSTVVAGSPSFTLKVYGADFIASALVKFGTETPVITVTSSTEATVTIESFMVATPGIRQVSLTNPGPGGGETIGLPFDVTAADAGLDAASD